MVGTRGPASLRVLLTQAAATQLQPIVPMCKWGLRTNDFFREGENLTFKCSFI